MYDQVEHCIDMLSREDRSDEQIQQLDATIVAQTALLDFAVTGNDSHEELFAMLFDVGPDGRFNPDQLMFFSSILEDASSL